MGQAGSGRAGGDRAIRQVHHRDGPASVGRCERKLENPATFRRFQRKAAAGGVLHVRAAEDRQTPNRELCRRTQLYGSGGLRKARAAGRGACLRCQRRNHRHRHGQVRIGAGQRRGSRAFRPGQNGPVASRGQKQRERVVFRAHAAGAVRPSEGDRRVSRQFFGDRR